MAKAQQPGQPAQPQQPQQADQHVEQLKAMGVPQQQIDQAQQELKQRGLNFGGLIQTILSNLPALLKLLDDLKNSAGAGNPNPPAA